MTGYLPVLLRAVANHARLAPDRGALVSQGIILNYRSLHGQMEQAARALVRRGVKSGERVGVAGHKTPDSVVAILAVLRAGATYVPLDPRAPMQRNSSIVADADCSIVLVSGREGADFGRSLARETGTLALAVGDAIAESATAPLPSAISADDIAYCMFTSGSTGKPKGAQIPHRAMDAFFAAVHPLLSVPPAAHCLNTSALHFDVSVVDVLYPLTRGATVFLTPLIPLPPLLVRHIEEQQITHMALVGSTLSLLAERTGGFRIRDISSLRRVMTGAEVLSPGHVQQWLRAAPRAVIINGYGPTEATCLAVAHPIDNREPPRTEPYPIGRPLNGVRVLFLDDAGQADARGPGEILIGGDQVMTGYLNRPDEDEHAFVNAGGMRFYRTGDLGHCHDDGSLRFIGRRDDQVKVRGYRVNLGEVSNAIESHALVDRAFVYPATRMDGRQILACAIVARDWPQGPPTEWRESEGPLPSLSPQQAQSVRDHVGALLPEYMIPADFRFLDHVPILSTGKADHATIKQRLLAGTPGTA